MGRRQQDDALGGPPPDLASDAILDLARSTLDRMAEFVWATRLSPTRLSKASARF
jgi:hypothetical protein